MKINKKTIVEKIAKQNTDKPRRGRPRKNQVVETTSKSKKTPIETIKSDVPRHKMISSEAKKLFMDVRKPLSEIKKITKMYSKLLSEAMKLGDQKTIGHLTKLFGYAGYEYAEGNVNIKISGKVKTPAIANIPHAQKEEPIITVNEPTSEEPVVEDVPAEDEVDDSDLPVETPIGDDMMTMSDEDIENQTEIPVDGDMVEKLANGEIDESDLQSDSLDDEDDYSADEDGRDSDIDDDQAEYRREFFGSIADNGDDW